MRLKGADIILECLLEHGVDTVFGYPGGAVLNIYDSIYRYSNKIRHILTSHEQHAGHAADGYARATGKTGVVIATSGPGATNLVTAIATAKMDSIPLLAITGNVDVDLLGLDSFQEVDITGITMPVTKHNFLVRDVYDLADAIRKAFFIANDGRKGPVLIDVPKNVTAEMCAYVKYEPIKIDICSPVPQDLENAVVMIKNSKKPFIYAGGGVTSSGAESELKKFAEVIDATVASSLMGQGCFDQTDPRYIGMLGMHGTVAASIAAHECDLFIALGTRFSDRVTGDKQKFAAKAKILHIDIDEVEHGKNIPVDLEIVCDAKTALSFFNKTLKKKDNGDWVKTIHDKSFQTHISQDGTKEFPVTPELILKTLDKLTDNGAIITTEVGQNQMWAAMYGTYKNPRSFITSGGLGTMGFGLGAAIGAKIGRPDKTVVNVAGDGSFGMNLSELVTLSKYKIPIIQLVLNNNVLGMVRQWQRLFYEQRYSHTTLDRSVDYVKLGEAFGIKCLIIESEEDVELMLKQALALSKNGEPVLIECRIDRDINVLPMVPAGQDIGNPIIEMFDGGEVINLCKD
ncbi:MAG: biosynthetic-type acetolactate synthase large subunit [Eubacterium sp.]|jgi:acetolactate synthase-1/2/3 large subunit|nr:biosynthetic-type acetolactate synthase large subunit [Eubacterium sp.]